MEIFFGFFFGVDALNRRQISQYVKSDSLPLKTPWKVVTVLNNYFFKYVESSLALPWYFINVVNKLSYYGFTTIHCAHFQMTKKGHLLFLKP